MKKYWQGIRIVSVSLGSSQRDKSIDMTVEDVLVSIARIGTNGCLTTAERLIRERDGQVDAICLGGIDRYLRVGERTYEIPTGRWLAQAASMTPVVDGSGLKNTLERDAITWLHAQDILDCAQRPVLLVSALDRFGMAEALVSAGANPCFGDLIFSLGVPVPIRSLRSLEIVARTLLPTVLRLPFHWLYPTGTQQDQFVRRGWRWYEWAEVLAGDFLYIRRYLPDRIDGKVVLTNTVRAADIELLRDRGCRQLITTTPQYQGESFGTNIMEGLLLSLHRTWYGGGESELTSGQYRHLIERLGLVPQCITF